MVNPSKALSVAGRSALVFLAAIGFVAGRPAGGLEPVPAGVREFLAANCLACHDDASATARLSVESLGGDFADPRWARIHDRVAAGEMPPADETQPEPAARQAFAAAVAGRVTEAVEARHAAEGRVVLRRMNRREYEHALHDLLGIATPLAGILPEDPLVHGFDTTSSGLEISAAHLLRYQQAADAALAAALPRYLLESKTVRWSGKQYLEQRLPVHRTGIDPFVRVAGDALVLHARLYGDNSMQAPHPAVPGRYRIRAALRPVGTAGQPMTVLVGKRVDRFQAEKLMHVVGYRDLPADVTTVVEAETDLKYSQGNQFIYFEGLSLPWYGDFEKARGDKGKQPLEADFAGPGLVIEWAELTGPLGAGLAVKRLFGDLPRRPRMPEGREPPPDWTSWPPTGEFVKYPLEAVSTDPKADAERLIRGFLPLAFRRPVPEELVGEFVGVAHAGLDAGLRFDEALRAASKAVLCSPHFLCFVERPGRLDDHAVAARLARFLWSSVPDEPLLAAAAAGRLTEPAGLQAEAERMLADPKSSRFVREFTDQWLDLARFLDMMPDEIYVETDGMLLWSAPEETRAFFARLLAEDLPAASIFDSDWTMLNERLARHYGIEGVAGAELRPVPLEPEHRRGGVITQASFLKMSTNASYTSPVKRGAWVLERILGTPPNPPPPDVEAIEPDIRGATTIREQLALHKSVESCAACHRAIDPPGFALENYDVVGGWRERYRVKQGGEGIDQVELASLPGRKVNVAKPVEPGGEMPDGSAFRDLAEYKRLVLRDRDQIARALVEKLVVYATGAPVDFADRAAVEKILADTKPRDHGLRSLVHAVIQSPMFLSK
jgi:mono/diheme cytochrome c family protein